MNDSVAESYIYCQRIARREAGNFYHAFRVLPRDQRLAMCALYAFLRVTDDLGDEPGRDSEKRAHLAAWRQQLDRALAGHYDHPLHAAFDHAVKTFGVPREYLEAAIDGVGMDLEQARYATFDDLYQYCFRVASAVGLACIHIWTFRGGEAKLLAEKAGIGFQLTNILRDLKEDAERGRIYLPEEDLARFGYDAAMLNRSERNAQFRELMRFQVERARGFYESSQPLATLLPPAGHAVFLVMSRTYRGILEAIESRDYDVFSERVRLSRWRKTALVLQALPVRFGW